MAARVILAVILLHTATLFGVIVADRVPPQCEESKKLFCGTPLEDIFNEESRLKISLNPFTAAATVVSLVDTLRRLLWLSLIHISEPTRPY